MYPASLSSRATGPKIRLPFGFRFVSIITHALSSKRIYVPSFRLCSFLVRTMTALCTSPFLTCAFGRASFTATTTTSPIPAVFLLLPPRTLTHCTFLAPLLSATFRYVCICIIRQLLLLRIRCYFALSTILASLQCLSLLSGLLSITRTKSPICASFFSSWALTFLVCFTYFLYSPCNCLVSTATTIVFSILSLVTRP